MKKILAFLLAALMILTSLASLGAAAVESAGSLLNKNTVTNLFELVGYGKPNATTPDGKIVSDYEYITGKAIPVTEGDVITIAPVILDQGYQLLAYGSKSEKIKATSVGVQTVLLGDSQSSPAIMSYTVPAGVTHIAPVGSQMYTEYYTVTKNQPLTKEVCFFLWENIDLDVINMGKTTNAHEIVNLLSDGVGGCGVNLGQAKHDGTNGLGTNNKYRATKNAIPVTRNDVVYFVGQTPTAGYTGHFVSTFKADGTGIGDYKHANLSVYAEIGNGFVVYAYRPYPDAASVRISALTENYDKGIILVTKNQPFDGDTFRAWGLANGVDLEGLVPKYTVDTESPLYKKSALFIGDSITYGKGEDTEGKPKLAWAGRLALMYDMTVINAGDSGARVSQTGTSGFIIDGLNAWTGTTPPDMVVMHGGVNDARYNSQAAIGTVDSTDKTTFCGGLNLIFELAKSKYPNADLFYIANFYIPEGKGTVSNMGQYYDLAKQICDKYGVTFIDLHGNEELNNTLANKDANGTPNWSKYMPDKLHPNSAGYDVITPYIAEALEAYYLKPEQPEDEGTTDGDVTTEIPGGDETTAPEGDETTAPEVDGTTAEVPGIETDPATDPATDAPASTEKKSCSGFGAAATAFALAVSVFGAAITVIKKK